MAENPGLVLGKTFRAQGALYGETPRATKMVTPYAISLSLENAIRAREEALDPAVVVDTAKVGAAVVTAELTRDRLQAALPRLRTRYTEVREQEDIAAWKADAEKLAARRNSWCGNSPRFCRSS
jgi:hypothetical protein